MRAGWITFLAASVLLAAVAGAQATQPAAPAESPQQQIIRRGEAATGLPAGTASGPSATRVALSLGAVLALIVGLFLAGRRFLPRGTFAPQGGGAVAVLARTAVSPKQRILLVQVGQRILVVADGGQNLSTLCESTDAAEAAALLAQLQAEKGGGSFGAALNGAMDRFRAAERAFSPSPAPPAAAAHAAGRRDPQPDLDSMRQELEGLAKRVRGMAR